MITIDQLKEIEIKIGTIKECVPVEGSVKLFKLAVDFGDENRQILTGIHEWYEPSDLIGKQCPFVTNLEPRLIMGLESQGMILATDDGGGTVLLNPNREIPAGANVI